MTFLNNNSSFEKADPTSRFLHILLAWYIKYKNFKTILKFQQRLNKQNTFLTPSHFK